MYHFNYNYNIIERVSSLKGTVGPLNRKKIYLIIFKELRNHDTKENVVNTLKVYIKIWQLQNPVISISQINYKEKCDQTDILL